MSSTAARRARKAEALAARRRRRLDAEVLLQHAMREAARDLGQTVGELATSKGKTFEAWAMLQIAVRLGGRAVARDHLGRRTTVFNFRGGPGGLSVPRRSPEAYREPCFFRIYYDGYPLELHAGLEHQGASSACHELDLSVVCAFAATRIRRQGRQDRSRLPYWGPLFIGMELKDYDPGLALDKNVARALLGVAVDLNPGWVFPTVVLGTHGGHAVYRQARDRERYWLLTSSRLTPPTRDLLAHYGIEVCEQLSPSHSGGLDGVVEQLDPGRGLLGGLIAAAAS